MKVMTTSLHGSAGFHVDTLNEVGAVVQMQVEPVDTLTMLGATISSKGFTSESVDHRAAKATGAFWKHSKMLCSRSGPLKRRFEEYQRRVVPVFFHGAGCWSWNHDLRMKVHRWEGKHLAKMMPLKKSHKEEAEDNDAYDNWWARRISVARKMYENMGFKSMVQRVLEHI